MKELIGNQSTILLVDDDLTLRDFLAEEMNPYFNKIEIAANGIEAINILKTRSIDIVVTDYLMPQMNGIQLVHWLKQNFQFMPVIMITTNSQDNEIKELFKIGVYEILTKPVQSQVLVNRIQNTLILPILLKLVWSFMSNEMKSLEIDQFLKMSVESQMTILNAFYHKIILKDMHGFHSKKVAHE